MSSRPGHRPVGQATRGKTAPERLRRTDTFVAIDGALRRGPARVVDLGYGADATTVVESYQRLVPACPQLCVIGIEIDRERVAAAQSAARPGRIEFRHGGFEAVSAAGPAAVVRAMNVLRQYDESAHAPAVAAMAAGLADRGTLIEGTSSPSGRLLTANLYRRRGGVVEHDGLLLAPNPRRPWEPRELQTVLPKNLIHHCEPGSELDGFFARFERAVVAARASRVGAAAVAARVVDELSDSGYAVDRRPALVRRTLLLVRLPAAGPVSMPT
jgi:hypothetical protein